MTRKIGRSGAGAPSGHEAAPSAAEEASSQSRVPNVSEAEAERAISILQSAIEAASNSNQAGENAVVLFAQIIDVAAAKPEAVTQFLACQEVMRNPATIVRFRAGFILCREYMARFVEAESPSIAASIRANWIPSLGDDPGPPRIYNLDEIFDEDAWQALPVSVNREASCEAAAIMTDLGMLPASAAGGRSPETTSAQPEGRQSGGEAAAHNLSQEGQSDDPSHG